LLLLLLLPAPDLSGLNPYIGAAVGMGASAASDAAAASSTEGRPETVDPSCASCTRGRETQRGSVSRAAGESEDREDDGRRGWGGRLARCHVHAATPTGVPVMEGDWGAHR
jgi:hypothetical protein